MFLKTKILPGNEVIFNFLYRLSFTNHSRDSLNIKLIGIALYFSFKQMEKKSIAYKKEAQVPEFIFPPLIKNIP